MLSFDRKMNDKLGLIVNSRDVLFQTSICSIINLKSLIIACNLLKS